MATTQNEKPANGNGKAVVGLRPLNVNAAITRVRRTSEQATAAKIERKAKIAQVQAQRSERFALAQQRSAERAKKALEDAQRIEAEAAQKLADIQAKRDAETAEREAIARGEAPRKSSTVPVIEKTPEIADKIALMGTQFEKFFEYIHQVTGIQLAFPEDGHPELVKRGYISIKLRGYLEPQKTVVSTSANSGGTSSINREAMRFMDYHKEMGFDVFWLRHEIHLKDDDSTYTLSGFRGKAHTVILRNGKGDAFGMSQEDFKKAVVEDITQPPQVAETV